MTEGNRYIFLDVDGVLNQDNETIIRKEKVQLLKQLVNRTGAHIVVSSSWRLASLHLDRLKAMLSSAGLSIYGCTAMLNGNDDGKQKPIPQIRALEIVHWLVTHGHGPSNLAQFVVLDDQQLEAPDLSEASVDKIKTFVTSHAGWLLSDHFVLTDDTFGLTEKDVEKAASILMNEQEFDCKEWLAYGRTQLDLASPRVSKDSVLSAVTQSKCKKRKRRSTRKRDRQKRNTVISHIPSRTSMSTCADEHMKERRRSFSWASDPAYEFEYVM